MLGNAVSFLSFSSLVHSLYLLVFLSLPSFIISFFIFSHFFFLSCHSQHRLLLSNLLILTLWFNDQRLVNKSYHLKNLFSFYSLSFSLSHTHTHTRTCTYSNTRTLTLVCVYVQKVLIYAISFFFLYLFVL